MKTNAIVRIILFSITIVFLAGILLSVLAFDLFMFDTSHFTTGESSKLPIAYDEVTASGAADAGQIRNLQIEWVAGSITIQPDSNTDQINIQETGFTGDKYLMVYRQVGDTLKIQFCEDNIDFPSFGITINGNISKDLIITVPADWNCDTLEIDAASASVNIRDMNISLVDFDGASGTCRFTNCAVGEISMDTASGDVEFSGTLDVLDFDGASADCTITVNNVPRKIEMDTASGDLELWLPEDCGFSCSMDTMSGDFSSEFGSTMHNGYHVYGDGSCVIQVDAMSGDVCIRKHTSANTNAASDTVLPSCSDPSCTDESHHHESNHSGSNHH